MLNYFRTQKGGRRAALPGFIIFSTLCGAGQICYTSIYHYRQQLILKSSNQDQLQSSNSPFQNVSDKNIKETSIQNKEKKASFLDWLAAIKWSPVTKLSEEQYRELMKAKEEERLEKEKYTNENELN